MITDDLSVFFSTDDFAEACSVGGVQGTGIFNTEYLAAQAGDVPQASVDASLLVRASEFPSAARGQAVVVRGVSYAVYGPPEPDGTGLVLLRLKRA